MSGFDQIKSDQRKAASGGRRGPKEFTAFVTVASYQPAEAPDTKSWKSPGHKDDRMTVTLMHDIPGLAQYDAQNQQVSVPLRLVDFSGAGKHHVVHMAKGHEGKDAMLPRNNPVLRVEGVYNPSTKEIEAKWINRIHAKYDPQGAAVYAGAFMMVGEEGGEEGNRYQTRNVVFPEMAAPLSMFGADTDSAVAFMSEVDDLTQEQIQVVAKAMEDFRSGDRDRVEAAIVAVAAIQFDRIKDFPGRPNVEIRGMDANGAAAAFRIVGEFRDPENGDYSIKSAQECFDAVKDAQKGMIDFAVANPGAYWDAFPHMTVKTGSKTLPSVRQKDKQREASGDKVVKLKSDDTYFLTARKVDDEGNITLTERGRAQTERGYRPCVMGVGRASEVNEETGGRDYVGGWYGMGTTPIDYYGTNYALEILPTPYMDAELLTKVKTIAEDRQKAYWKDFRQKRTAEKDKDAAPEQENSSPEDVQIENEAQPQSAYGM